MRGCSFGRLAGAPAGLNLPGRQGEVGVLTITACPLATTETADPSPPLIRSRPTLAPRPFEALSTMNQPRPTTLKSTVLAVIDLGLLFGYALAISLLARLLIFSDAWYKARAFNLAQFASRYVFLPGAVWLRVLHRLGRPPAITQGWVDVGSYSSAVINALLWTGMVLAARFGQRRWQGSLKAPGFVAPVIGSRRRLLLAGLLPVLLALAASPWTKEARVTAACIDRLARLPVGTSIETVRAVLDNVWSDPWPSLQVQSPAARPYQLDRIPLIPDPDTPLVDVLCTNTEARDRQEISVRLSFVRRRINNLRTQICATWEGDLHDCFDDWPGSPLPGRPSATVPIIDSQNDRWWVEGNSLRVTPHRFTR